MAILVLLAACGVRAESATFVTDDDVPFDLLAPTSTTPSTSTGPAPRAIKVCFVMGSSVVPVDRRVTAPGLAAAVTALTGGPTGDEQNAGLRTALLTEDAVREVSVVAGVARVELASAFAEGGTQDSILAIAQLVCTLTAQPGVGQVAFALDGQPVDVPLVDGSLATRPVTRDDYASLIAAASG
jgi:spore germination protein GerM